MAQLEAQGFFISLLEYFRDEGWDDRGRGGGRGSSWSCLKQRGGSQSDQHRLSLPGNANLLTPGLCRR